MGSSACGNCCPPSDGPNKFDTVNSRLTDPRDSRLNVPEIPSISPLGRRGNHEQMLAKYLHGEDIPTPIDFGDHPIHQPTFDLIMSPYTPASPLIYNKLRPDQESSADSSPEGLLATMPQQSPETALQRVQRLQGDQRRRLMSASEKYSNKVSDETISNCEHCLFRYCIVPNVIIQVMLLLNS